MDRLLSVTERGRVNTAILRCHIEHVILAFDCVVGSEQRVES